MNQVAPPPLNSDPLLSKWLHTIWKAVPGSAPLVNAVNDAAAEAAGVPLGGLYRNGSVLMIRVA